MTRSGALTEQMTSRRNKLINKALKMLRDDMENGDYDTICALLDHLSDEVLTAYLPMDVALELEQEKDDG